MMKLKYASFLTLLVVLQACGSSKTASDVASENGSKNQVDSVAVKKSQTAEEAGITISPKTPTKSIVTPEKKKK